MCYRAGREVTSRASRARLHSLYHQLWILRNILNTEQLGTVEFLFFLSQFNVAFTLTAFFAVKLIKTQGLSPVFSLFFAFIAIVIIVCEAVLADMLSSVRRESDDLVHSFRSNAVRWSKLDRVIIASYHPLYFNFFLEPGSNAWFLVIKNTFTLNWFLTLVIEYG